MRAVLVRLLQRGHRAGPDGVGIAAADEHRHLRVGHIRFEVGRPDGLREPGLLGEVAGGAVRIHVGAAERVHEALRVVLARRARILHHGKRLGAVLRDDIVHLLADLAERLIPSYYFEFAVFVLLHRVGESIGRIGDLGIAVPARAQLALSVRMGLIPNELRELAVYDVGVITALARAGIAQRVHHFGSLIRLGISIGFAANRQAHKARAGGHGSHPGASN